MTLLLHLFPTILITAVLAILPGNGQGQYVEGIVVDAGSGKPVPDVYVYTLSGEEEQLTNEEGRFKFKTWRTYPIRCTATHRNYEQVIIPLHRTGAINIELHRNKR